MSGCKRCFAHASHLLSLIAVVVVLGSLPGCFTTTTLNERFYEAPEHGWEKFPLTVAIVEDETLREAHWKVGVKGFMSCDYELHPGFTNALHDALSLTFDTVTLVKSGTPTNDADYVVGVDSSLPDPVALSFRDAATGVEFARYEASGLKPGFVEDQLAARALVIVLSTSVFFIVWPVVALVKADEDPKVGAAAEKTLSAALSSIVLQIRQDTRFIDRLPQQVAASAAVKAGDAAAGRGENREAFDQYVSAYRSAVRGSELHGQSLGKLLEVLPQLQPAPEIPDDAKRFMLRGLELAKVARDPSGFQKAALEMEKAIRVAPWWWQAFYNVALMHEGAENYQTAIYALEWYLRANPNGADGEAVRNKIYVLQLRAEEAAAKSQAAPPK